MSHRTPAQISKFIEENQSRFQEWPAIELKHTFDSQCQGCGGHKYRYAILCKVCAVGTSRLKPVVFPRAATEAEKAYAAGFYEGEGTACFHAGSFRLDFPQQSVEPLLRFSPVWGGKVMGPNSQNMHCWSPSGLRALRVAEDMWDWLSEKRKDQISQVLRMAFPKVLDTVEVLV